MRVPWYAPHEWPVVRAQDDRWVWSTRCSKNWQRKLKYPEKICRIATDIHCQSNKTKEVYMVLAWEKTYCKQNFDVELWVEECHLGRSDNTDVVIMSSGSGCGPAAGFVATAMYRVVVWMREMCQLIMCPVCHRLGAEWRGRRCTGVPWPGFRYHNLQSLNLHSIFAVVHSGVGMFETAFVSPPGALHVVEVTCVLHTYLLWMWMFRLCLWYQ